MARFWNARLGRWDDGDPNPWGPPPIELPETPTEPEDFGPVPIEYATEPYMARLSYPAALVPDPETDPFGGAWDSGPSSLDLTAGFGVNYREPEREPEPPNGFPVPPSSPDYGEIADNYGLDPFRAGALRQGAEARAEFVQDTIYPAMASPALSNFEAGALPLREQVVEPTRKFLEKEIAEPIAGATSLALRMAAGDTQAPQRNLERVQESGLLGAAKRAYEEESIPFVTGVLGVAANPENLFLGGEGATARALAGGLRAGGRAAGKAAGSAGDAAWQAGMRAGEVQAGVARDLGLLPPAAGERPRVQAGRSTGYDPYGLGDDGLDTGEVFEVTTKDGRTYLRNASADRIQTEINRGAYGGPANVESVKLIDDSGSTAGAGGTAPPSAAGTPPGGAADAVGPGAPDNRLPRQLGVSIQEADDFGVNNPVLRRLIDEDPDMFYDPIGNRETMAAAAARVDADPDGALSRVLAPDARGLDVEAEGLVLLRRAAAEGDTAKVMQIARPLAAMGTRSGQEVQIWSVLDKLSPEGILITLHRKVEQAAKQGKGAGVQRRIDDAATRLEIEKAKADAEAELALATDALLKAQQEIAALRRQAEVLEGKRAAREGYTRLAVAKQELRDILFPTKHGRILSRAEAEIPDDVLEALRAEAAEIARMPDGPERDAAAQALLAKADAAAVTPGAESRTQALQAGQRNRDKAYLTDDTVRDVVPREITSERTVITKVKAILKQAGAEMSDEEADEFLDLARELNDLPEAEQITRIMTMVEDARRHPEVQKGLAGGIPRRLTPEREALLLQRQAADIRKLVHPEARSPFQRLNSPDRLAMARVMAALRRTGQKLTDAQAEAFTREAYGLQDVCRVPVQDQARAVDDLVRRTLDTPEIQAAMQQQRTVRDAEAAVRREARQVANDMARMTTAAPVQAAPKEANEYRSFINEIVRVLRSVDVQLPPGKAAEWRERAMDFAPGNHPPDQARAMRAALLEEVKEYDPLAQALARKEAEKARAVADAQATRQLASDLERLRNPEPKGGDAAVNEANRAITGMVALLRKTGVRLSEAEAVAFREAAQSLLPGKLAPEAAKAAREGLLGRFKASTPVGQELARLLEAAAVRQENRRAAKELAFMLDAGVRKARPGRPMRGLAAIGQAKGLLARHGAEFPDAAAWLADARDLARKEAAGTITPEEAEGGYQALMELVREADPVKRALAAQKAKVEEAARLRQRAKDLEYLTSENERKAKERLANVEREVLKTAKQRVREAGVEIPEPVAQMFLDRAHALRGITDEYDQMQAAQALMHDINAYIPPSKWDAFLNVLGLPRALKATWDLSFILRQGIIQMYGHPKEWAGAFKANIEAFRSEEVANAVDRLIVTGQFGKARLEAGVERIDRWAGYARGEETFLSDLPGRLADVQKGGALTAPVRLAGRGARASERAYITTGNKLRADVWDNTVRNWLPEDLRGQTFNSLDELVQASGHSREDFERLANWVNVTTGRGKMPAMLKHNNQWLNALFFAPRFAISRFQVPAYAITEAIRTPALRKTLARDMVGFTAGSYSVLALMDQVPGVEVEWDARSSDFGKIRYGDLRIDFLGGYAPLVRYTAQFITGQSKSPATGRISDVDRLQVFGDFLATKLAPAPGEIIDQVRGVDALGGPVETWGEESLRDVEGITGPLPPEARSEWARRMMHAANDYIPFLPMDLIEAWKAEGVFGAAVALPASTFGGGISGYSTIRSVQDDVAREQYKGKAYIDLEPTQKAAVNNDARVQVKIAESDARERVDARNLVTVTLNNLETANKTTESTLLKAVAAANGQPSEVLRNYIKEAKQKRFTDSRHAYNQTVEAALKKGVEVPQKDILRDEYWSAEVPEDFTTGELDFKKRDAARADVLRRAKEAGIPESYITQRVSPWKDPKVRAAVEAYEKDMETLRPYWEVADKLAQMTPLRRQTQQRYVAAKAAQDTATVEQIERSALWSDYQFAIREERRRLRENPAIRAAGERWGLWKKEREGIGIPVPTIPLPGAGGNTPVLPAPTVPFTTLGVR